MSGLELADIEAKYADLSTDDLKTIVVNKRHEAIEAAIALALRTDADDLIQFFRRYPLALSRNDESLLIKEFASRGIPYEVTAAAIDSRPDATRKRAQRQASPKAVSAGSGSENDPVIPDEANPLIAKQEVIDGEVVEHGPTYKAVMEILDSADQVNAAIDNLLGGKPRLLAPAKKELREVPGTARAEWTKQLNAISQRMAKVGRMVIDI